MGDFVPDESSLPLQGRKERMHLYDWVYKEEDYVADKFDDQRDGHDDTLKVYDLDAFWKRQVIQYIDRAKIYLEGAATETNETRKRVLELWAQQAMAKCMMTAKGMVESSIRVYGPLPKAGVPSGEIEPHHTDTLTEL